MVHILVRYLRTFRRFVNCFGHILAYTSPVVFSLFLLYQASTLTKIQETLMDQIGPVFQAAFDIIPNLDPTTDFGYQVQLILAIPGIIVACMGLGMMITALILKLLVFRCDFALARSAD